MKPLKKAEQKNIRVNTEYYTEKELDTMYANGTIYLLHGFYVVYTSYLDEIKVAYNKEYEFYETIAIHENGSIVRIVL